MADMAPLSDALRGADNLLIQAWPSPTLFKQLRQYLADIAGQGHHVIVLEDSAARFGQFGDWPLGRQLLAEVLAMPDAFTQGNGLACSLRFLLASLANHEAAPWFDKLGTILVPVGEQILRRAYAWELLAASLQDRALERGHPLPRFVVVIAPRRSAESAIRDILPVRRNPDNSGAAWSEILLPPSMPRNAWWTVWTTQSPGRYGNGLNRLHPSAHYQGVEPALAHFAGVWNIRASHLLADRHVATIDQGQAIQKSEGHALYQESAQGEWGALSLGESFIGAVTLRDTEGNPWRSLHSVIAAGGQDVLVNIVSQQTALLPYLLDNARLFAYQPLEPLSPKKAHADESAFDTIVQLAGRLRIAGRLRLDTIRDVLLGAQLLDTRGGTVVDQFKRLLGECLHPALAHAVKVSSECQWQPDAAEFQRVVYLSLGDYDFMSANHIDWLKLFEVRDETGTVYRSLRADHVLQTYLPGQITVIAGRTFKVERIAWAEQCIFVTHDDTLKEPAYRTENRICFISPPVAIKPGGGTYPVIDEVRGFKVEKYYCDGEFEVETLGFRESADQWATPPRLFPLEAFPKRHYRQKRFAKLRLCRLDGSSLLPPQAAVALAAWLNEAALLLFPEIHRFFIAAADVADTDYPQTSPASGIVPRLSGERCRDNSVLVFEDSHGDLGLARAMLDHCQFILDLCNDHLAWLLEESPADARLGMPVCLENRPAAWADFFRYGAAERDPAIGLEALREALQSVESWFGEDALTRRRRQALAEAGGLTLVENLDPARTAHCDFCGVLIASGEQQILPEDQRIRCMDCAQHGIDSLPQLQALYPIVKAFFTETLGVGFVENVDAKLTNQADLARRAGQSFIPTSGFDPRAIGLAVSRSSIGTKHGEERHEVLIESGFSPEQTAATLAHELAHVWQYNYLDHGQIRAESANLLLEGHAVWVAGAFLRQHIRQANPAFDPARLRKALDANTAQTQRDDVYGRGYALLLDSIGHAQPFQWLQGRYPR